MSEKGMPKKIRSLLSRIYIALRDSAHQEYVEHVKSIYKIHPSFRVGLGTIISGTGSIEIAEIHILV